MKTYWTCRRAPKPGDAETRRLIALVTCEPGRAASLLQPDAKPFTGRVLPSELVPAWAELTALAAAQVPGVVWETWVDELPVTSKGRGLDHDRH